MKSLLNGHQILLDYNYLVDNVVIKEVHTDNIVEKRFKHNLKSDLAKSKTNELLISIIDKSRGLIGQNSIEKLCKMHEIKLKKGNNITIKDNVYKTLNNFIESLIVNGGNIIKIMLHNMSHEMDMAILEPVFNRSNRSIFFCQTENALDKKYFM